MSFHESYRVRGGDNLTRIAKARGFDNPGPIVAYPENRLFFRTRSPNLIRPGDAFLLPYHPDLLRKIVATSELLIAEVTKSAAELIREETRSKKEIDDFLFKIDAVNFLANVGVSIGSLTAQGAKAGEMSADDLVKWFAESRTSIGGGVATMTIPAPSAPKRDFRFFVRHTLGPWNPSYWTTLYGAIRDGDLDLYLYGTDAVTHRNALKIKAQADKDIERLRKRANDARTQLGQPFYKHRI